MKRRIACWLHIPLNAKVVVWLLSFNPYLRRYGIWTTDTRQLPEARPKIKVEIKIVADELGWWFYGYDGGKIIGHRYSSLKRTSPMLKGFCPVGLEGKMTFGSQLFVEPEYRRLGVSECIYTAIGGLFQPKGLYQNIGAIALDNIPRIKGEAKQRAMFLGVAYHLHLTDGLNFFWQGKELKKAYKWLERELARESARQKEA